MYCILYVLYTVCTVYCIRNRVVSSAGMHIAYRVIGYMLQTLDSIRYKTSGVTVRSGRAQKQGDKKQRADKQSPQRDQKQRDKKGESERAQKQGYQKQQLQSNGHSAAMLSTLCSLLCPLPLCSLP
jgi:hypothetical protein